jgi:hypothetical protein
MAGDGLRRPLNAPSGIIPSPGVQPGVSSGVIFARYVIVFGPAGNPVGVFVYTPGTTPGAGNPPDISITQGTTDPYTNTVRPGVWVYGTASSAGLEAIGGTAGLLLIPSGLTHGVEAPQVFSAANNIGLANEYAYLVMLSGEETPGGNAAIQLFSETADGTGPARGSLLITGNQILGWNATQLEADQPILLVPGTAPPATGTYLYATANGIPAAQTADGVNGALDICGPANTTTNATVNAQTSLSKLSNSWAVPATDANAGTIYRLTAAGTATWGSTQEALTLALSAFGVSNFVSLPIGATEFTASLALQWRYQAEVVVVTPGAVATIMGGASLDMGVSGANELTQAGTNQSAGGFAAFNGANATADTAVASNITLQAKWAGAFGSITCDYSYLERLGA